MTFTNPFAICYELHKGVCSRLKVLPDRHLFSKERIKTERYLNSSKLDSILLFLEHIILWHRQLSLCNRNGAKSSPRALQLSKPAH